MNRVLVITGAGISAESGIPTFRGPEGYWRKLDPVALATADAFVRDPALVWDWYRERRAMVRSCVPNAAHAAVVQLAQASRAFLLLTQNVDDLHQRAVWNGQTLTPEQIVPIHGGLFRTRCFQCDYAREDRATDAPGVPRCPACGGFLRPGVVWFDEDLDPAHVQRVEAFIRRGGCDLVLVIGTSAAFDYILQWARSGVAPAGRLVEVNPEASPLTSFATETLRGPAARVLPPWVESLTQRGET